MNTIPARMGQARALAVFLLVGALFLALSAPAVALDPTRSIREYSHAWYLEQLPQNTVLAILQRRDGSMWFATYSGIARHSGAEFRVIDKRSAETLQSTAITALLEDTSGTLWIATLNGGLYRMQGAALQPQRYDLPAPIESVFAIVQDTHGALWMGTNAGVLRLDASGTRLFGADQGIVRVPIRGMAADAAGGVWVATDAGVAHFQGDALELLDLDDGLPDLVVWAVNVDRDGAIWIGTQRGLARYRAGRFERVASVAAVDGMRITTILGDRDGNLWSTADGAGLCRLNAHGFECDRVSEGLSHDAVRSIYEDREGNLWIGATSSGVHRLSDSKLATAVGTLNSNSVRAVFQDAAGTLWAGTDGAGLAVLDGFSLTPYAHNDRLPSAIIRALYGDARGDLWVGSIMGLSRVQADGRVTNYDKASGLPGAIVFAIAPDRATGLWIGTSLGLAHLHEGQVETIAAVGPNDVRSLHLDRAGQLWIGQRIGLQCLRGAAVDRCGTSDGLPTTSVFAFHEASADTMWMGTSKGLMRLQNGKLTRYTEREGLVDEAVFVILDDGAGYFWISSNRGIARLAQSDFAAVDRGEIDALRPRLFGKNDGMLSTQANGASQSPGLRAGDGRLWFATPRGVVMVDPTNLRRNELPPLVAIERMIVDTVEYNPQRVQGIGPGVEKLEFHYAAMSYVSPDAVRYRYRLDGFDRGWVDAGARRVAYYTNLRPGDYTFRIIASNNDGVWNEAGAALDFRLRPYFTQTRWFDALLATLGLLFLWGLYWTRLQVITARADVLEERNRIAREMHDSLAQGLAGIAMQLRAVKRAHEVAPERMEPLLDRADVRFKEAMEETRRAVFALRPLALERHGLVSALRELIEAYPGLASPIQFQLSGTPGKLPDVLELHLFRLAQEAIANAVKHANANAITLGVDFGAKLLKLKVSDNGQGMGSSPLPDNRGLGLAGMRKRVAQLGGRIEIASAPGSGTDLTVTVPRPSRFWRW